MGPVRSGRGRVLRRGHRPKLRPLLRAELMVVEALRPATRDRVGRAPVIRAVRLVAAVVRQQAEILAVLQIVMPGDRLGCGPSVRDITRSRRSGHCQTTAATLVSGGRHCGSGEVFMKVFLKVLWAFLRVLWLLVMGALAFLAVVFGALAEGSKEPTIENAPHLRFFD